MAGLAAHSPLALMRSTTIILLLILNCSLSAQTGESFSLDFESNKFGTNKEATNKIYYVSDQTLHASVISQFNKNEIDTSFKFDHENGDTVWRKDTLIVPFRQSSIDSIADLFQTDTDTIIKTNPCDKVEALFTLKVNFNGQYKVFKMYDSFDSTAFIITKIIQSYFPRNTLDPRPIDSWRSAKNCWEGIKKSRKVYEQTDNEIFAGSFYSIFFGKDIQSVSSSNNKYRTTIHYYGKKLDKPIGHAVLGKLKRELVGIEFKYRLIKSEPPKKLELIKMYHLHVINLYKYLDLFEFDPHDGYWIDDSHSQDVLDSLVNRDIELSSRIKENEIGIYLDSSAGNYYIKSDKYCARVKISIPFRFTRKGKYFLKKYNYRVDKGELCKRLLNYIHFCDRDINNYYYENNWGLDKDCYNLYAK